MRPWWAQKRTLYTNLLLTRVTSAVKRWEARINHICNVGSFCLAQFDISSVETKRYRETLPTNWLHPHRRWLVGTLRALVGISMGKDSFCCRNNEPKHASKLCENYSRAKENQGILDISPTVTWPDPCRIFTIWGTDCAVPYFLLYILLQWWILLL